MSRTHSSWRKGRQVLALGGAVALGAFALLQASAVAAPLPVTAPLVPGAPTLFGPLVDAGTPSDTAVSLKTTPDVAPAGTKVTISGTGLAASKAVSLVWMTANVRYILDAKPDSVDYLGRKVDKIGDHRRERRLQGDVRRAEGLRRPARHLRRHERRPGR
jgi:hypothetical protein